MNLRKRPPSKAIPPNIGEFVAYDPATGEFTWKRDRRGSARAGSRAGCIFRAPDGCVYWRIKFMADIYFAHRVAWFLVHGEDVQDLDHKDRDGTNNRIDNLRVATRSQQAANRRGFGKHAKGVFRNPQGTFTAHVRIDGKKHHLGTFRTEEEASSAYAAKAKEAFGEFSCVR